jgi:hypothetical protein
VVVLAGAAGSSAMSFVVALLTAFSVPPTRLPSRFPLEEVAFGASAVELSSEVALVFGLVVAAVSAGAELSGVVAAGSSVEELSEATGSLSGVVAVGSLTGSLSGVVAAGCPSAELSFVVSAAVLRLHRAGGGAGLVVALAVPGVPERLRGVVHSGNHGRFGARRPVGRRCGAAGQRGAEQPAREGQAAGDQDLGGGPLQRGRPRARRTCARVRGFRRFIRRGNRPSARRARRSKASSQGERRPHGSVAARVRRAAHRHHHRPRLRLPRFPLEPVVAGVFLRPGRSSPGAALVLAPLGVFHLSRVRSSPQGRAALPGKVYAADELITLSAVRACAYGHSEEFCNLQVRR